MTAALHLVASRTQLLAAPDVIWRAGQILERSAADVRLLGLGQTCRQRGRHRPLTAGHCVHRCVTDARNELSRGGLASHWRWTAATGTAFAAVEAEGLHADLPADWDTAADLLLAVAGDLYRRAAPTNTVIVRIG